MVIFPTVAYLACAIGVSPLLHWVTPATAATVGVVLKVLPDVLDIGVVLKHGARLAVNAAVTLDGFDALAQYYALNAFLLVLGTHANHVEIYVPMIIQITQYLKSREQPQLTLAGTDAAAD